MKLESETTALPSSLPGERPVLYRAKRRFRWGRAEWIQAISLLLLLLVMMMLIVLPLLALFRQAFVNMDGSFAGLTFFRTYLESPALLQSMRNTVFVSFMTTIIAVPLAFLLAYALARTNIRGKSLYKAAALLPLFAPTMMHGIGLVYLFGHQGIISTGFFGWLPFEMRIPLYGKIGIIISEVIYTFPQAFLILSAALSISDYRLYEAAETLGAGKLRKLVTVTLPSIKYGLISAVIVCATLSFTDFGAPKVVGGQYNVLATDMFKQVIGQQNMALGAVVSIMLSIPAVVAFIIDRVITRKQQAYITSRSTPYMVKPSRIRDAWAHGYASFVALAMLLLLGAVVIASLIKVWPYNLTFTLSKYNFTDAAAGGLAPFWNSVKMALWTALAGTCLTFMSAYLIEHMRVLRAVRQASYFLSIIPLALPGLAIGLAYIFFFNDPANPLHPIYGTMVILVLANVAHFYSVPFMTATTSLKMMDREFSSVSASMNVSWLRFFTRITVPLSLPAILEMAVYFFVNAMVTVSAVIFLYGADLKLASVAIVSMDDAGDTAKAAAMSVLIVGANLLVRLAYEGLSAVIRKKTSAWRTR
ncbi:iron(III) transport system permease protein [Paenibacillus phyllosphaerae]|uniref:Iron(III) transport system permease protein n=1 Tax=Paenibacillus phyllosphaerae TaxID=274593 RepID=A0A7W5FMW5_9BACL|nr:putative 2-aminoethylphosphonate ABC transporter permease subunit [Paenibacillus phyllosphaerae]MBB3110681.1 iron(III) transport system permease protein [Paenibacillus phyllosphaerae]